MLTLEGEYPRPLSDVTVRAMALYYETLQAELEPEQIGRGLAIHPDSGDYLVADTPTHAGHALRRRHPEGGTVTLRIGLKPDHALLARIGLEKRKDLLRRSRCAARIGNPGLLSSDCLPSQT